jgi:molecular chaperone HscC
MTAPIVGIDLGTTYSLVSVLQNGVPVVLPNAVGETLTASAVSVKDNGEVLVGAPARARAVTAPLASALAFKRDMGTAKVWKLGALEMTPVQLSALVLKALKADAEAALGQPIAEAVITVPAYFGDLQRQATRDAGALAGLKVDRIINEPTAAALAYGLQNRNREQRVAVLDLGGGTFDVTVLEIIEGVIEVQSSAGDARLGGEDFDAAVLELMVERLKREGYPLEGEDAALALLREASQSARHRLSLAESTRIALPGLSLKDARTLTIDQALTRADCETAWKPLLDRIRVPVERALSDAHLPPSKIDEVVLVGGATRMPCVAQLAATLFGRLPLRTLPPDEAIAMGAAVQAGLKANDKAVEDIAVTDVAPFSLGVATSMRIGRTQVNGVFKPMIERGTTIPASRIDRFHPMDEQQTKVKIEVYQGEHAQCDRNQFLGAYLIQGLAPGSTEDNGLDCRFTYDLNGILEVEITRVKTGTTESFVIQNRPGALSPESLAKAREEMKKWKVHPREMLPNTTALERAEAVHAELLGDARAMLALAIAEFRSALDAQEPARIVQLRERLVALTRELKSGARR